MSGSPMPSSFDNNDDFYEENRFQKLTRRLKEEPLIPLGCALTCWALLGATRSIRSGDHNRTQRMFRARIYAQGFTIAAMVAGSMYWQTDRQKRKEFDKVVEERKAKEKNEAWIRELEARDEEAKEERARRLGLVTERKGREGRGAEERGKGVVELVKEKAAEKGADVKEAVEHEEKKASGILQSVQDAIWKRN